jgi:hypothetical protein
MDQSGSNLDFRYEKAVRFTKRPVDSGALGDRCLKKGDMSEIVYGFRTREDMSSSHVHMGFNLKAPAY